MWHIIKGILIFIVVSAVTLAVLRAFGWDLFGVVEWVCHFTLYAVTRLADALSSPIRTMFGK